MRLIIILFTLFYFNFSIAQDPFNPGNLGVENLSAWFKATDLEIEDDVTAWPTSYTNLSSTIILEDNEAPYPYASNQGFYSNYNNAVNFEGSTVEAMKVLEVHDLVDLLDNTSFGGTGTFLAAYYLPSNSCAGCHVVNYREGVGSSVDGIQFRAKLGDETGRLAIGSGNSPNGSADYIQDFRPNLISYCGNRSSENSMKPYKRSLHFTEGVSSATTGETGLYFGARRHNGDQYNGLFDGLIYEVIFYDRDLTAEEFAKVHSYLAIKHGITLDNEGGGEQGDYVSTIGSTVWDADSDPDFHNQVIGIAQEESEGLFQMQSHTFADTSRIYIGDLAPGNAENQASFGNARTYMIMGNNGGAMCGTESSNLEIPDNEDIIERIEREWKVTNTNFSQDLSLDFRLGSCVEINSLDDQQLRLLVDENSDFSNANVYSTGAAVKLSLVDGVVKVEDIHTDLLPMNESRFVTIAISSVLSNELKEDMANFMIYPNPANEFIVVKGKFLNQDVEIYNALGQQVTSIETSTLEDEERVIDISALPKGSYFVKVGTARKTLIK